MKEDTQNVSRRNFLSSGIAATGAVASILVIESSAASESAQAKNPAVNNLYDCTQAQTLVNKIIPSNENILGTDYVNVREFKICDTTGNTDPTDITDALNDAIASLKNSGAGTDVPRGGQIIIPRGRWKTRGGHEFYGSISIEGVGTQLNPHYFGVPWATELELIADGKEVADFMFKIVSDQHNCSLKNMSVDLSINADAVGLLITDGAGAGTHVKFTTVENVTFLGGDYGIKVDSANNFECILNRFERVNFVGCKTSFYCNTVNSGFLLDTCYFLLPENGTAINLIYVGNISIEHSLFVPLSGLTSSQGTTILKTVGTFNSISFYDCQDEGIVYAYQNSTNFYDYISIVYRNCLIQSKFKFTAPGAVVLDSCRVASFADPNFPNDPAKLKGAFEDSSTAYVKVYLQGQYNFFNNTITTPVYTGATIATFVNPISQIILEGLEIGSPEIVILQPTDPVPSNYVINKTRGLIYIEVGGSSMVVYNNLVSANSIVFAQLQTSDPGGARIREVVCSTGYFQINLSQAASTRIRVGFKVEYL